MSLLQCRLCSENQPEMVNLTTSQTDDFSFEIIIYKLFSLKFKYNDTILICKECHRLLNECSIFYQKVQKAQEELNEKYDKDDLVSLDKIKKEDVNESNFTSLEATEEQDLDDLCLKTELDVNIYTDDQSDADYEPEGYVYDVADRKSKLTLKRNKLKKSVRKNDEEVTFNALYKSKKKGKRIIVDDVTKLKEGASNITDTNVIMNKDGAFIVKKNVLEELINNFFKLDCQLCSSNFKSTSELFDHYESQHQTKGYLVCCGKNLEKKRSINHHLARHVQPSAFQCHVCNKSMSRPGELKFHLQTHLPESDRPLRCHICNKSFVYPSRFKEHLLKHSPVKSENEYEDNIQLIYLKNKKKKGLVKKLKVGSQSKKIKPKEEIISDEGKETPVDPNVLINKDGLFVVRGVALEKMLDKFYNLYCELCSDPQQFKTIKGLFDHYSSEHNTPGYVTCCNIRLDRRKNINYHMAKHLQPSAFECHICKKTVSRPGELKFHIQIHLPDSEKPLQCEECGKGFVYSSIFKKHKLSHVPVEKRKIYQCKFCSKSFNLSTSFSVHVSSKHSGPKYLCSHCGKTVRGKLHYRNHLKTHDASSRENEKVQCKECGITIANKIGLRKHMRRHTLTIFCKQCDYVAHSNFQLKKHVMIRHTDIKPHICVICGKDFKLKHSLKVHMAQHTGERNYSCPYCFRTFVDPGNCYSHQKKMHPNELKNSPRKKFKPLPTSGSPDTSL